MEVGFRVVHAEASVPEHEHLRADLHQLWFPERLIARARAPALVLDRDYRPATGYEQVDLGD